jgi:hypothetical protein
VGVGTEAVALGATAEAEGPDDVDVEHAAAVRHRTIAAMERRRPRQTDGVGSCSIVGLRVSGEAMALEVRGDETLRSSRSVTD